MTWCSRRPGDGWSAESDDENGNEKLDRNFLGIPSERFGFSNLSPRMRRASWDEAVFNHAERQTVTVDLVGAGG